MSLWLHLEDMAAIFQTQGELVWAPSGKREENFKGW
jgi:hypothetical protein